MSAPVIMTDWTVVGGVDGERLVGRTTTHPSPLVTPGKLIITSPIVTRDGANVVTQSGTRYLLEGAESAFDVRAFVREVAW